MKWTPGGTSQNVEDRRGETGGGGGFGGGGMRLGLGGAVVLLVLSLIFRQNLFQFLENPGGTAPLGQSGGSTPQEDTLVQFVSFVLDSAQASWARTLPAMGVPYQDAHLVLFRDGIESACGFAETATGPFYCPGDQKVYIDLGFYQELRDRFGASGDFAQAYVLAHEIGHHVQTLMGTEARARRGPDASVRLELQADCYAGVWAHEADREHLLDPGDLQEGITAAAAVGDDRLQRMATGHVNPETFTHGSSAERVAWFRRGYTTGRVDACDTFSGPLDIGN
ncbi:MAG TPA: neutral zinc metallopeptidase [Gemmatimonadales bacterium]|nr:neutral zinc metallopeptidase [Gemmatimonadales bacterium]